MRKYKGKLLIILLAMVWVLTLTNENELMAAGGSSSLGVSSSSVNIGDTVTVTLTVKTDVPASVRLVGEYDGNILKYTGTNSSNDCNEVGGKLRYMFDTDGSKGYSVSCTFEAVSPGTASISVSVSEAIEIGTEGAISVSGASASVTVNNAASPSPGGGGGGTTTPSDPGTGGEEQNKSGDNSLRSLTISPGTLSPSFKYSTTKYTASVAENVTSVAVDAQVSNSNATVESVTGNTNLQMGENTIKIVVKAENGTIATYTITVTRGGEGAVQDPEDPDATPEEPAGIVVDGVSYEVSATLPEEELPQEFQRVTTTYQGEEVEVYSFPYENLQLFYLNLMGAEESGGYFFLNEKENRFFPYINITLGSKYALILPVSYSVDALPEGYQLSAFHLGNHWWEGYQLPDAAGVVPEDTQDFYVVYGVDSLGNPGWYRYDALDGSLQRYADFGGTVIQEVPEGTGLLESAYADLDKKYTDEKHRSRVVMAVFAFVVVVLVIVIINILLFAVKGRGDKKAKNGNKDIDYIDFDEL